MIKINEFALVRDVVRGKHLHSAVSDFCSGVQDPVHMPNKLSVISAN